MNKNDNAWIFTGELSLLGKILFIGHNFWALKEYGDETPQIYVSY